MLDIFGAFRTPSCVELTQILSPQIRGGAGLGGWSYGRAFLLECSSSDACVAVPLPAGFSLGLRGEGKCEEVALPRGVRV